MIGSDSGFQPKIQIISWLIQVLKNLSKRDAYSRLFFLKICYNIQNILLILHGENMAVKKKKIVISKLNRNNNHKHSEKRKRNK